VGVVERVRDGNFRLNEISCDSHPILINSSFTYLVKEDAMSTSSDVIKSLDQALTATRTAVQQTDDLIVAHDYQDVASLVANAAAALLQSASYLMQSKDEDAFSALEQADDYLDAVYDIIDSETEQE
jgi:hypothetical protein